MVRHGIAQHGMGVAQQSRERGTAWTVEGAVQHGMPRHSMGMAQQTTGQVKPTAEYIDRWGGTTN